LIDCFTQRKRPVCAGFSAPRDALSHSPAF